MISNLLNATWYQTRAGHSALPMATTIATIAA